MKKILFTLVFLFCAIIVNAQTMAGYFAESTQPIGLAKNAIAGQKQYTYGVTVAIGEHDSTSGIASQPLGENTITTNLGVRNSFMGQKIPVGINITVGFAAVSATLVTQVSFDGKNWVTLATLSSNTSPNTTGTQIYLADFTSVSAPYARLLFNAGGLKVGNTGRIQFMYGAPL